MNRNIKLALLIGLITPTLIRASDRAIRDDIPTITDQPVSAACCPSYEDLKTTLCLIKNRLGVSTCGDYTLFQLLCLLNQTVNTDDTTIISKLDIIQEESWSIESKCEAISYQIDHLDTDITLSGTIIANIDLTTVTDMLEIIDNESWSIESKAEVISSKIDDLKYSNIDESTTVISKLDIIDNETWSIESKAEVISSKIDNLKYSNIDESATVISKLDIIDNETWSIESKAEVISSKIDVLQNTVTEQFEFVESRIDELCANTCCSLIPITTPQTLDTGAYCLAQDIGDGTSTVLTITGNNVTIDLMGRSINGQVVIADGVDQVALRNGTIDGNNSISPALYCPGSCSNALLESVIITNADIGMDIEGTATNLKIRNSLFTQYGTEGLLVNDASTVVVSDSLFVDSDYTGTGIAIRAGTLVDIRNTDLKNNLCGIYLGSPDTILRSIHIEGCFVSTNSAYGITFHNCKGGVIVNCEVTRFVDDTYAGRGIYLTGGQNMNLRQVSIAGFYEGVYANGGVQSIGAYDCRIRQNAIGIRVEKETSGFIEKNLTQNNSLWGMVSGYEKDGGTLLWQTLFTANISLGNGADGTKNFAVEDPDTGIMSDPGQNAVPFNYLKPSSNVPQNLGYWTNISSDRGISG